MAEDLQSWIARLDDSAKRNLKDAIEEKRRGLRTAVQANFQSVYAEYCADLAGRLQGALDLFEAWDSAINVFCNNIGLRGSFSSYLRVEERLACRLCDQPGFRGHP